MSTIHISGNIIYSRNDEEARQIYASIFERQDYDFKIDKISPTIIDCGAHIGLATLYFKKRYPSAEIIAIEPNPVTLGSLKKNIEVNGLKNIKIIWGAVGKKTEKVSLFIDTKTKRPWSWDDSIIKDIWINRPNRKDKKEISVPGIKLSSLISKNIDLLKLDIEGAETDVIEEIEGKLNLVDLIIMEYHPSPKIPEKNLTKIKNILVKNSFILNEYPVDWALFIKAKKKSVF